MNRSDGLLPIGIVARSFGVNESTIRRMESAGLLVPAYKSDSSGYRYYDSENLSRISTILALRSFGFVYEDMRDHFQHPGDYSVLYDKLIEKQNNLRIQIEKVRRHLKAKDDSQCEFVNYEEAYCLTKKASMTPSLKDLSVFCRQFLFEAVEQQFPINYARAVLIITDCMDYRSYQKSSVQELTFCIPLRKKVSGENILHLHDHRMIAATWSHPGQSYSSFIPLFDELFRLHHLRQNGPIRCAYDVGGHLGGDISPEDSVMHILIPIE